MKNYFKRCFIIFLIVIFSAGIVFSASDEFAEAKKIIDAKTPCVQLTESQLEGLGDYFMEQMHPGQAHEAMDKMMGGEGSQSLRLMHIAIAKRIYCNEVTDAANYGMMGTTIGLNYRGMMNLVLGNNLGYGTMGNYGYGYWGFWSVLWILFCIGMIALIIWLIYKFIKFIIKNEASEAPIEILKKRFASGEITKKQFEQMKKGIRE